MFFVIVVLILGTMHLYLWKRLIRDTSSSARTRWVLSAVLIVLFAAVIAALLLPRLIGIAGSRWIAWPGYLWFGLAAYLFLALLVLEPVRVFLRRRPRLALARWCAAVAGAVSLVVVGVGVTTAMGRPDVLQVPVELSDLDPAFDGYRITVASDIHLGPLLGRAFTERLVQSINDTDPDLVVIVGDLVDGSVEELASAAEPLQDLVSRDGAYFVTGNHEYFVADPPTWLDELQRLGVHPLHNASIGIDRDGGVLQLAGVNDLAGAERDDAPDFERALAGLDPDRPTVLLSHQPVTITEAAEHGVALQISGHTHGGQMWPFHYAVRAVQPALAGLSEVGGTQLYITRGAGFWGPPLRIGAPPDITVLSLRSTG